MIRASAAQKAGAPRLVDASGDVVRGDGAGRVWAARTKQGYLKVVIETGDLGHAGEYGFAYSEVPLLRAAGIDADSIVRAATRLVEGPRHPATPVHRLQALGQSAWLDFVDRRLLASGALTRMIERDGLRGLTCNPSIFQNAIAGSTDYDDFVLGGRAEDTDEALLEDLDGPRSRRRVRGVP